MSIAGNLVRNPIHKVVELAVKYDKLIDVHCDESDDLMSRFVELLTALSIVEGIGPKTTGAIGLFIRFSR